MQGYSEWRYFTLRPKMNPPGRNKAIYNLLVGIVLKARKGWYIRNAVFS